MTPIEKILKPFEQQVSDGSVGFDTVYDKQDVLRELNENTFVIIEVEKELPRMPGECHIAFVPKSSFQSCRYYNGSKTWQSLVTRKTVTVTHWLKRQYQEIQRC